MKTAVRAALPGNIAVQLLRTILAGLVLEHGISSQAASEPKAPLSLGVPRTLELTQMEPKIFATALGKDRERIFNFVRDQIGYECYPGELRGPRGTLIAMAGNSVDRASLLASLLTEAGQHVRFAAGKLNDEDARQLVQQMWSTSKPVTATETKASESLSGLAKKFRSAVQRDYGLIRQHLAEAKVAVPPYSGPSLENLAAEAKEHYWVQCEIDGKWTDFDPSFSDAAIGKSKATPNNTFDKLPEALQHRIKITIKLEEYQLSSAGNEVPKVSTREVLSYTSPSVDLAAADLVLLHRPENWKKPAKNLQSALDGALSNTGRIKPVLGVPEKKDLINGQVFSTRVPKAGIGDLSSMLSGAGTRKAVALATAEWLEFETTALGGEKSTTIREIFDLVGPARRAENKNLTANEVRTATENQADMLRTIYDLFITNGRIDASCFAGISASDAPKSDKTPNLRTLLRRISTTYIAKADALSRIDWPERSTIRVYPTEPRLTIAEVSTAGKIPRLSLDLREDRCAAIATGPHAEDAFAAQIFRGVVNGTLERLLVEDRTKSLREKSGSGDVISTSTIFEKAIAEKMPIVTGTSSAPAKDLALPAETQARIADDWKSGQVTLSPGRKVKIAGNDRFAWWRIDPKTGVTIAVTDEGLHQTTTERSIVTVEDSEGNVTVILGKEAAGGTIIADPGYTQVFVDAEDSQEYIDWLTNKGVEGVGAIPENPL